MDVYFSCFERAERTPASKGTVAVTIYYICMIPSFDLEIKWFCCALYQSQAHTELTVLTACISIIVSSTYALLCPVYF